MAKAVIETAIICYNPILLRLISVFLPIPSIEGLIINYSDSSASSAASVTGSGIDSSIRSLSVFGKSFSILNL